MAKRLKGTPRPKLQLQSPGHPSNLESDRVSTPSRWRLAAAVAVFGVGATIASWQAWLRFQRSAPLGMSARQALQVRATANSAERHSSPLLAETPGETTSRMADSKDPAAAAAIDEAFGVAQTLLEQYPSDVAAVGAAAQLYRQLGDTDQAVVQWQQCLALDPEFLPAYLGIGSILLERGQYDRAETVMRRALAVAVDSPQVAVLLATALTNQGKLSETVALLEPHTRDTDAPMPCFLLLGHSYLQLKEYAKAKPCFEVAVNKAPDFAAAHYGLAMACTRLGQSPEAKVNMARFREAEQVRLSRQIEGSNRRNDIAAMRKSAAEAHATAANICSVHGDHEQADRHRQEAERLNSDLAPER